MSAANHIVDREMIMILKSFVWNSVVRIFLILHLENITSG